MICNILNHGKTYDQWSTSFIIALSKLKNVERVAAVVPPSNGAEDIVFPSNCDIFPLLNFKNPLSILSVVFRIRKNDENPIIIVYGPTAFGRGNLPNLFGMFLPIIITIFTKKDVKIISQGSVFTHDSETLGYNSFFDTLRKKIIMMIEKFVYIRIRTYFQLNFYSDKITRKLNGKIIPRVLKSDYIDPVTTLYLNGIDSVQSIDRKRNKDQVMILLHGFWGPQKDLEVALQAVMKAKRKCQNITLTVSGGINHHFPDFEEYFKNIINKYQSVIDIYRGYVKEKELSALFLENDIVLMPYRASGGQSGVLEMASFFENIVVCTDFPEFQEEKKSDKVILTSLKNFSTSLDKAILLTKFMRNQIDVQNKIDLVHKNIEQFIEE